MNYGIKRYNQNTAAIMDSRQVEIMAFGQSIVLLRGVNNKKTRLHALNMNQKLWSAILRETGIENNGMPENLRQNLFKLSVWATRYSIRAMLHDLPLKPLISINQDMLDGLKNKKPDLLKSENFDSHLIS
ncbi:flagellar biosynthesis regulator FlaF [Acetobacter conturbans]|uniref:Flagellar biosynthesis regulator FlhF n=1 Tax=Acetobacter conturbans TaxID=1737472 RepID=A0ABX0K4X4_9PROT|nr:flagellar biosynthesis regulator FlaF [Acetobacter conturbans]NHN88479.1 hypothetical protein [Acetobacter conturbans]